MYKSFVKMRGGGTAVRNLAKWTWFHTPTHTHSPNIGDDVRILMSVSELHKRVEDFPL